MSCSEGSGLGAPPRPCPRSLRGGHPSKGAALLEPGPALREEEVLGVRLQLGLVAQRPPEVARQTLVEAARPGVLLELAAPRDLQLAPPRPPLGEAGSEL
eukprot:15467676-Alexandrium_andersonii.AAC.1